MFYNYTDEQSIKLSVELTYSDVRVLKRALIEAQKSDTGHAYEFSRMSEQLTEIQKRVAGRGRDYYSDQLEQLNNESE